MMKYNQFAGVSAALHNAESLSQAISLNKVRARKELIYAKTGWFLDADKRWKFEIDDSSAKLVDGWRNGITDNGSLPLNQVLFHNSLFENYPQLKELSVCFVDKNCGFWGEFDDKNGIINLNESVHDDGLLKTLCHESNHGIQDIEKFGMGGTDTSSGKKAMVRYLDHMITQSTSSKSIYKTEYGAYRSSVDADVTREKIDNISVMIDAERLVNYAHSDSPSRLFRNVRNSLSWIYSDRFKDPIGETSLEVRNVIDDYLNIPKSNKKGVRNDAIADVCIKASQILRNTVPISLRNEMKESGRNLKSWMDSEKRLLERQKRSATPFYELEREIKKLVKTKSDIEFMTGGELYAVLNGEETSRATEKRLNMTEQERMERPPWLDMLPVNKQVAILYRDGYEFHNRACISTVDQVNKASIEFGNECFAKMLLHPLSDVSSVMHESAHYFLEVMSDLNIRDGVKPSVKDDFNDVLNYLGTTEIEWYSMSETEKEPYHEKFAEGFEDYLINSDVKDLAISNVFEKLKGWISAIYEKLGANKLASSSGAEHIYERLLLGDAIDMADHGALFSAIGDNIGEDVKEAAESVYSASMGYFSDVSGLSPSELTHRYDLIVEHDEAKAKDELIDDASLETMTQDDYVKTLKASGFDVDNVYYHGTASNFEKFDESFFNKNENSGDYLGCAFYFAKNKQKALTYAKQAGGNIVKEVFLRQKSPLVIPDGGCVDKSVYDGIDPAEYFDSNEVRLLGDNAKYYATFEMEPEKVAEYLKSKGFDGLMDNDYGQAGVFYANDIIPSTVDELRLQRGVVLKNLCKLKNSLPV